LQRRNHNYAPSYNELSMLSRSANGLIILILLACVPQGLYAQKDSTVVEEEDYSNYTSTESSTKYCTQKVRLLSPTKLVSAGYEWQAPYQVQFNYQEPDGTPADFSRPKQMVTYFGGMRLLANAPVISRNNFILNLGANYNETQISIEDADDNLMSPALADGLYTLGLNATAFKPFDDKHFMILSAQADWNSNKRFFPEADNGRVPTATLAGLFGWKKNDNYMIAIGATQTWRGGEKLYVPLLLLNKTFNDKWGLEMLLPARAHVRYNFSAQSLLLGGFEIEGNSYNLGNYYQTIPARVGSHVDAELRRSELKFRMIYERKITGFFWLSVQAGLRYNYKFNVSDERSSARGDFVLKSTVGNTFYTGLSINLVSP